jgi:hypothetical protein
MVREGLSLTFYMRPPHDEIALQVLQALDVYLRGVGPSTLELYADQEGEWQDPDEAGWSLIRRKLQERGNPLINLRDAGSGGGSYSFLYWGKALEYLSRMNEPDAMCEATFWLPTKFLEEHGPGRVRELAMEIASLLPLCSGSAACHSLVGSIRWEYREPWRNIGCDIRGSMCRASLDTRGMLVRASEGHTG